MRRALGGIDENGVIHVHPAVYAAEDRWKRERQEEEGRKDKEEQDNAEHEKESEKEGTQ